MRIYYWNPYLERVGTVKATLNSAIAMKRRGHDVKLYRAYHEWEDYEELLTQNGIEIIDLGLGKRFHNLSVVGVGYRISMIIISIYCYGKMKRNYAKDKPDVIVSSLLGYLPLLARKRAKHKPKIICGIQGKPYFHSFRKHLWGWLYKDAEKIVVLTEKTREDMREQLGFPEEKFVLLHNPIIDDRIEGMMLDTSNDLQLPEGKKVILGIGRLTRQKDLGTLIKAFSMIPQREESVLVILGEGEDEQKLKQLVRELNLENQVIMPGFAPNPYAYLRQADVFVLSSLWEDAGLILIEAAYCRTPIVCTKCPYGQEEFLDYGKAGELCEIGDAKEMAECIARVLDTAGIPERKEKVQRAYDNSMEYHMTSYAEKMEKLLQTL